MFESVNGNVVGSSQVTLATGNPNRMHGGAADLTGDNAPELIMNNGYFANQATGIPDTSGGGSSAASFIKVR